MLEIFQSLLNLFVAVFDVVKALFFFLLPYIALISWVAYWLLAVNWVKLYEVLFKKGGIIGFALICFMTILIWGLIAPPAGGFHSFMGMHVSNFIAKTVYVSSLVVIIFMCGSVQLSGALNSICKFDDPAPEDEHGGHGHGGHGHDSHGHDSHGHDAHAADSHGGHGHDSHGAHAAAH